jgi:hypothetical protein
VPDTNPPEDDRFRNSRQNIYLPGAEGLFSPREVARMTGYKPVSIRLICRQLLIGQKVDGRFLLNADDVSKIIGRKNLKHHQGKGDSVNMSKTPIRPLGLDPLIWKMFDSNRYYTEQLEIALKKQSDRLWDMGKSLAVVAGDVEELRKKVDVIKKREEEKGRGVLQLGRSAPSTLVTYEAEAA